MAKSRHLPALEKVCSEGQFGPHLCSSCSSNKFERELQNLQGEVCAMFKSFP